MHDDKVLLVTGASSDVGSELIRRVEKNYNRIWAHYRSSTNIIDVLKSEVGDRFSPIQADFSDIESTLNLIQVIMDSGEYPNHIVHLSAQKAHSLQFHKHS